MNLKLQVLFNFLSKFSLQLNVFILSIILVRYLDKTTYGTYLQFQLCVNTGIYMFTLGIPHSMYYFYSKAKNKRWYALSCLSLLGAIGVLVGAIMGYGDYLGNWLNNPELNKYTLLIGIAIVCLLPYELAEPFLISAKRSGYFSVINATVGVVFFATVFTCLYVGANLGTIFTSITSLYVVQFIVLVLLIIVFTKADNIGKDNDLTDVKIKQVMRYSFPISLQLIVGYTSGMLDRYIISSKFTPDQLAVYSRGATQLPIVNIFPSSMSNILFPKYTTYNRSGQKEELFDLWRSSITKVALMIYPLFVFFTTFSEDAIVILYTDKYLDSVSIFQVYLVSLLVKIAIYDTLMRVAGKSGYMPFIAVATLATNLTLGLVFLHYFGIVGPAIATIIATFINSFLCLAVTKRIYNVGWRDIVPWADLIKILSVSLLAIFPFFVIKENRFDFLQLAFAGMAFFLIYVVLLVILKVVPYSEVRNIVLRPILNRAKS